VYEKLKEFSGLEHISFFLIIDATLRVNCSQRDSALKWAIKQRIVKKLDKNFKDSSSLPKVEPTMSAQSRNA
jgi:hypothetical protein